MCARTHHFGHLTGARCNSFGMRLNLSLWLRPDFSFGSELARSLGSRLARDETESVIEAIRKEMELSLIILHRFWPVGNLPAVLSFDQQLFFLREM